MTIKTAIFRTMTVKTKLSGTAYTEKLRAIVRQWRRYLPLGLAGVPQILRAENHVDYLYEFYTEDNNRMQIQTHGVYFEQLLNERFTAKGEFIYDGISGATPTGTLYSNGKPALSQVEDVRRAGNIELDTKLGDHLLTPAFAYSRESDYESFGVSLNDAIEFNEKNTTFKYGVSHNFDSVLHDNRSVWSDKGTTDGFIGLSQLLSPKTIFSAAFTFGYDEGYLSDPYRLAGFTPNDFPFSIGVPERRPSHRSKEVLYTSVMQYFTSVDASLEGSYRFYHDSYGVFAHTVGLTWHQRLGKYFIVDPFVRFTQQSAADFYAVTFSGPFSGDPAGIHSSDYRLSELYTIDYGIRATYKVCENFHLVAGYHRYEMHGTDGKTTQAMYPKANIFTVGFSILW
jgi:hypothetical protein